MKHYPPGTSLGSYRLDGVIGEGAMGIVYLASHARLGRRVAIKVLRSEYARNQHALRRFFDEARAVNKISHPNIVEVTDFVERPGEDNYYVMELLEGANLAELVAANNSLLEVSRAVAIMTQLAKALEAVHDAGVVHRDVKPYNIILIHRNGNPDFVKLVDFGVAQLPADDGKLARDRAETTAVVGTPRYMSPEQARGGIVDGKSDIYSFGAMLYELVTGQPPIVVAGVEPAQLADKLRASVPVPPSQVPGLPHAIPAALEQLILKCLAKTPAERPARIGQVADKLVAIADEEGWLVYELSAMPSAPSLPTLAPAPQASDPNLAAPPRKSRWLAVALVGAALAAGGAAVVMTRSSTPSAPRPDPAAERHKEAEAELKVADQRIASGRLVGAGGDEALDHLLKARTLDPEHPVVKQRLDTLARQFEKLAADARAADSLPEAAAHLETVLAIEPANARAAAQLKEVEQLVLERQRANPLP